MTFQEFVDCVGLISGVMTILGVSGLISWGITKKSSNDFAAGIIQIFAYSLKTAIAALVFIPFFGFWKLIYVSLFRYISGGAIPVFWNSADLTPVIGAYAVSCLFLIPIYTILIACFFTWSLTPLLRMIAAFRPATTKKSIRHKNELAGSVAIEEFTLNPAGAFATAFRDLLDAKLTNIQERRQFGLISFPPTNKNGNA